MSRIIGVVVAIRLKQRSERSERLRSKGDSRHSAKKFPLEVVIVVLRPFEGGNGV